MYYKLLVNNIVMPIIKNIDDGADESCVIKLVNGGKINLKERQDYYELIEDYLKEYNDDKY